VDRNGQPIEFVRAKCNGSKIIKIVIKFTTERNLLEHQLLFNNVSGDSNFNSWSRIGSKIRTEIKILDYD
jgi:hypothetical protein